MIFSVIQIELVFLTDFIISHLLFLIITMQINENFREEMLRGHFQGFLKMFDKINESTFYEFQLIELIILI